MSEGYGQFCPVAKAAEILGERWTLLVVRELLAGSRRFNDLRRGLPLMSPSLLSTRLKTLEHQRVIERVTDECGVVEYRPTDAGEALWPVIESAAVWGNRWVSSRLNKEDLDPGLLMWDIRRNFGAGETPDRRVVAHIEFVDVTASEGHWWLIAGPDEVDLCLRDPGYTTDLHLRCSLKTLTAIWLGRTSYRQARQTQNLEVRGTAELVRHFGDWLGHSPLADID